MSSKVKQANFRLPLEYMSMIDDFAHRENITKAAVITRALDCMQASYDSGNNGMPVTDSGSGISEQEFNDLKNQLKQAEERAQAAEQRANDAVLARDAAEAKAREAVADASVAAPSSLQSTPFRTTRSSASRHWLPSRRQASKRRQRHLLPRKPRLQQRRRRLPSATLASRL